MNKIYPAFRVGNSKNGVRSGRYMAPDCCQYNPWLGEVLPFEIGNSRQWYFLQQNTMGYVREDFLPLCTRSVQIPVIENLEERASTNALLLASRVAFLQELICSTNKEILSKRMGTKLDSICGKTGVVLFESCGHLH